MSWNDYVNAFLLNNTDANTQLTASNVCEHAAIIGNADGTVWASSPGFTLTNYQIDLEKEDGKTSKVEINEFDNLLKAFNSNGESSGLGGVRINKEKYFIVSFDSDKKLLYLKKSGGGACVAKSGLGIVIGTYNSSKKSIDYHGKEVPQNPGLVNGACESLLNFLTENNL